MPYGTPVLMIRGVPVQWHANTQLQLLPHQLIFAIRWNEADAVLSLKLAQFDALV